MCSVLALVSSVCGSPLITLRSEREAQSSTTISTSTSYQGGSLCILGERTVFSPIWHTVCSEHLTYLILRDSMSKSNQPTCVCGVPRSTWRQDLKDRQCLVSPSSWRMTSTASKPTSVTLLIISLFASVKMTRPSLLISIPLTCLASHTNSSCSPPSPFAAPHTDDCSSFISLLDFSYLWLEFGSVISPWLHHGNAGAESVCLNSMLAASKAVVKLISRFVDVKVTSSGLLVLILSSSYTIGTGTQHLYLLILCYPMKKTDQPTSVCGAPLQTWRHDLTHRKLLGSEVHSFFLGAISGNIPIVSSKVHHQRTTPTSASINTLLLLSWSLPKFEDCSPLALFFSKKASKTSSCRGHERSFSILLLFIGVKISHQIPSL